MKYKLPMPPSVNAMYRRSRGSFGMYKTAEAKAWVEDCRRVIRRKNPLKGRVDVSVNFYFERECDLDNRFKALFDVLQETNVIENDRQIYSIVATKDFDRKNPRVEIEVMEND